MHGGGCCCVAYNMSCSSTRNIHKRPMFVLLYFLFRAGVLTVLRHTSLILCFLLCTWSEHFIFFSRKVGEVRVYDSCMYVTFNERYVLPGVFFLLFFLRLDERGRHHPKPCTKGRRKREKKYNIIAQLDAAKKQGQRDLSVCHLSRLELMPPS